MKRALLTIVLVAVFFACGGGSSGDGSPSTTPDASANACTPQQSIACVGPGGCQGGQACLADGTGYAACDCGSSPTDAGTDAATDANNKTDASDAGAPCTTWSSTSIAAMRTPHAGGCFELTGVVTTAAALVIGGAPTFYVQDPLGGDYSAMRLTCNAGDTACASVEVANNNNSAHTFHVQGHYFASADAIPVERFLIDNITDTGAGTAPPSSTAAVADITRASTRRALVFMHLHVNTAADKLVPYDYSPTEFAVAGAVACPYETGFGLALASLSLPTPTACTNNTSQPLAVATPSASEILVSDEFPMSALTSDCRCQGAKKPMNNSRSTMDISGFLLYAVPATGSPYMYIAPINVGDLDM